MPKIIKILIIGNGFGGVYVLKNLHKLLCGRKDVEITLVGEKDYFLFTPLLHEVATGGVHPDNIIEPISKVLGCCLDHFYSGRAEEINLGKREVKIGENLLSYDYLVLAPGAETNFYNIPGAEEYSLPLKSIEDAIRIKNQIVDQVEKASHTKDMEQRKRMLGFVVVGGGPTGVELASELYELVKENFSNHYKKEVMRDASVTLIQKGSELMPQFGRKIREKSLEILTKKGIKVMLDTEVRAVTPSSVLVDNGEKLETEMVVWVAGVKPRTIRFGPEVKKSRDGRLLVDQYLQIEGCPEVFALGDNAAFQNGNTDTFLPALAQVAQKEAKAVARNIHLALGNKKLESFKYKHSGTLVSLGKWMAVGEISHFTFSGRATWWLWRTVYLSKLLSFRKKIKVALDWTIHLFSSRDISKL